MRKIMLSLLVTIAYIGIVLFFPRLRYYFPGLGLEVAKLVIAFVLLAALLLSARLQFSQLKIQWKATLSWAKVALLFGVLFFIGLFALYFTFLGAKSLEFPSINKFGGLFLVLGGTIVLKRSYPGPFSPIC